MNKLNGLNKSSKPCRKCGGAIYWTFVDGVYQKNTPPYNADGTFHNTTCIPKADDMGKTRQTLIDELRGFGITDINGVSLEGCNIKVLSEELASLADRKIPDIADPVVVDDPVSQAVDDYHTEHFKVPILQTFLQSGVNIYIAGPAGSGKTTSLPIVAKTLSREYTFVNCHPRKTPEELIGYIVPGTGQAYVPEYRQVFERGNAIVAFDEGDAATDMFLLALTALIDNGIMQSPEGTRYAGPNLQHVFCANTSGHGADGTYSGRNKIDAAFRNRFAYLEWPYDEKLEAHLLNQINATPLCKRWLTRVWTLRKALASMGASAPKIVISPRASIIGAKLMLNGITDFTQLEESLIWQGCGEDAMQRVLANV